MSNGVLNVVQAYRTQDLGGVKTVVKDTNPSPGSSTPGEHERKPQALPSPQWTNTTKTGPHNFNTPGPSGTGQDGKSVHKDKARTQGKPGDKHPGQDPQPAQTGPGMNTRRPGVYADDEGQSYDSIMPTQEEILAVLRKYNATPRKAGGYCRGSDGVGIHDVFQQPTEEEQQFDEIGELLGMKSAAINGPPYPGANRQRNQRGQAKRYYQKWYRRNRGKVRTRMRKWYTRFKNRGKYKRDQRRRRDQPAKFTRWPGGARSIKQRSKDYRKEVSKSPDKKAQALINPVEFYHIPTQQWGFITDVSPLTGSVTFHVGSMYMSRSLEDFFNEAAVDDDYFFEYLDQVLGYDEEEDVDETIPELEDTEDILVAVSLPERLARKAEMLYEKQDRKDDSGQKFDRAVDRKDRKEKRDRGERTLDNLTPVTDNPGSAKVIPEGHSFQNRDEKRFAKVAYRISDIMANVDDTIRSKSQGLPVKLKRVDTKNGMWVFNVTGKSGVHQVKVQGKVRGTARRLSKADVFLSCSCPYWRWQGPEHWARNLGYLYGKPVGTASVPVVKDPEHRHGVCQHALAVLNHALGMDWNVPGKDSKGRRGSVEEGGLRYLSDILQNGEMWAIHIIPEVSIRAVVSRYMELKGRRAGW